MTINGEKLKELRIKRGLTLKDVAIRLDVTEGTVSRYEGGQIKKVSPKVMLGYSKLFRVPINSLYENAETEWVAALEEAGLHDPRVSGFIEYLEEQAQKEAMEHQCTEMEVELVKAWREADMKTKHLVALALGIESQLIPDVSNKQ